jgi:hypothetical protein
VPVHQSAKIYCLCFSNLLAKRISMNANIQQLLLMQVVFQNCLKRRAKNKNAIIF